MGARLLWYSLVAISVVCIGVGATSEGHSTINGVTLSAAGEVVVASGGAERNEDEHYGSAPSPAAKRPRVLRHGFDASSSSKDSHAVVSWHRLLERQAGEQGRHSSRDSRGTTSSQERRSAAALDAPSSAASVSSDASREEQQHQQQRQQLQQHGRRTVKERQHHQQQKQLVRRTALPAPAPPALDPEPAATPATSAVPKAADAEGGPVTEAWKHIAEDSGEIDTTGVKKNSSAPEGPGQYSPLLASLGIPGSNPRPYHAPLEVLGATGKLGSRGPPGKKGPPGVEGPRGLAGLRGEPGRKTVIGLDDIKPQISWATTPMLGGLAFLNLMFVGWMYVKVTSANSSKIRVARLRRQREATIFLDQLKHAKAEEEVEAMLKSFNEMLAAEKL